VREILAVGFMFAIVLVAIRLNGGGSADSADHKISPARQLALGERVSSSVRIRETPLRLTTPPAHVELVTDYQLATALCATAPIWRPPNVPLLIHYLKVWGLDADFSAEMVGARCTGPWMVETLLCDKLCKQRTNRLGSHYLVDSPFGIHVVQVGAPDSAETRGEGHFGQLLKALGQAGVPAETPVITESGQRGNVRDLISDAVMRFRPSEDLDFVSCAFAMWLPPETSWRDQFGNEYSFDFLIDSLISRPLGPGSCGGCHRAYAVMAILAADSAHPLLSIDCRNEAEAWIESLSRLLEHTQLDDGAWDSNWSGNGRVDVVYADDVLDRITITGHQLEWIAMAPERLRPSKLTITKAVAALTASIERMRQSSRITFKSALPSSHAARALSLLRGEEPFAAFQAFWDQGIITDRGRGLEVRVIE
jgi:hypothetical protein